jgi:hypothetical protein
LLFFRNQPLWWVGFILRLAPVSITLTLVRWIGFVGDLSGKSQAADHPAAAAKRLPDPQ